MAISATVNAVFNIDNKSYTASLNIPNSAPSAALPFKFSVISQAPTPSGGTAPAPQDLLQVAVGGANQVYVAVSPPMDLMSGAVGSDIVKDLDVVVSEGQYNAATGTFTA
jgi:hypothetical protein